MSNALVVIVAVLAGVVLGAVDLLAQRTLPYPWANLANSSAVWALGAYAMAVWTRTGPIRCVVAAAILLVVAVQSYHVAAIVSQGDDVVNLVSSTTLAWLAFGLIAGCVFGYAGHLRASTVQWASTIGCALPVAVLLAEAALYVSRGDGGWDHDSQTAVIEVGLAVLLAALVGRGVRGKLLAFAVAIPFAALGWIAFRLAGFAG